MSERKKVEETICSKSFYEILDEMTPEDVIMQMQDIRSAYGSRDIFFRVLPYGFDGGLDLDLWETREETDAEYHTRVKKEARFASIEAKAMAEKEKKELAEYKRLKKKYEKVVK